jgi:hypothetical protein
MGEIVSKADFARSRGVSRARVSQWISEGKIAGRALVGEGRNQRIDAAVATAQLLNTLDFSQRLGLNGLSTRLGDTPAPQPNSTVDAPANDPADMQMKTEKLRQAQLQTRRLEDEDLARRGLFADAAQVRASREWAIAELLKVFDGALAEFASALSASFQIPAREAERELEKAYAPMRARLAASRGIPSASPPAPDADSRKLDA